MLLRSLVVLFLVTTVEAAGVPFPLPAGLLLVDAGGRNHTALSTSLLVLAVAAGATLFGALALYAVIRRAGPTVIGKYGKYVGLKLSRLERMQVWMDRRGGVALVLGRVIPGMSLPTVVVAGTLGISWARYAIYTFVGALAWAALYYYLGAAVGQHAADAAAQLADIFDIIPDWILIGVALLLLVLGMREVWRRRHPTAFESPRPT